MSPQLTFSTIPLRLVRFAFVVGLALGGAFLSACSREAMPSMEAGLVGDWEWEQTDTNFQAALTPTNTGHRMRVRFDHQGRVRFYQDNVLVSAATFTIRRDKSALWKPGRYVISYQGYRGKQFYSVVGSKLQLQDATGQLATHHYQRLDHSEISMQLAR